MVEDQAELADDIADGLRDQGIGADVAYDGSAAIEKALLNAYDVVVLDRDLPRIHGDAVCATLVGSPSQARILMLTAAGTVGDRVDGLNLGADDYLIKPFAFAELVARVRSLARRSPAAAPVITRGDLRARPGQAPGQPGRDARSPSTARKWASWRSCWSPTGPCSAPRTCSSGCGTRTPTCSARTVTVTIGRLRRKLGEPDPIETVIGTGYRLP